MPVYLRPYKMPSIEFNLNFFILNIFPFRLFIFTFNLKTEISSTFWPYVDPRRDVLFPKKNKKYLYKYL